MHSWLVQFKHIPRKNLTKAPETQFRDIGVSQDVYVQDNDKWIRIELITNINDMDSAKRKGKTWTMK